VPAEHLWITGERRSDRAAHADVRAGRTVATTTHRGLRGPYTGVDTVLRALLPEAQRRWPELVDANRVELLYGVPELAELVGPAPESLAAAAPHLERTRFYGPSMLRCMNQGVVTFLIALARRRRDTGVAPLRLVFEDVHEADSTTQEFIALLARRADPALITVVVSARAVPLWPELDATLTRHARREHVVASPPAHDDRGDGELVRAYVDADGTSDDPGELAAYEAADPDELRTLHDARAELLEPGAPWGVRVGAICYHRERGTDPGGQGRDALLAAQRFCMETGFSVCVIELGLRGRMVTDPDADPLDYCAFTTNAAGSMVSQHRLRESHELYLDLRRRYTMPIVHMVTSYCIAMLYTRFYTPRDHETAMEWQNNAAVVARLLPDEHERLVYGAFQDNALALIEMHRGNLERGLELVANGLARLDANLGPHEWALHRSQLLYNRGRLLNALGRPDEAYRDFDTLVDLDPYYTDYLSERAKVSRKRGDVRAALADYDRAVAMGPPFPELYYNRGTARLELDDVDGALADFDFVLEMEPDDVDTRLSRADTYLRTGDLAAARADAVEGLTLRPDEPRLLCLLGAIDLEEEDWAAALTRLDSALAQDSAYPAALVNRAVASYQLDRPEQAVADLTAALDLVGGGDPDVLLNRGLALVAAGDFERALTDFDAALVLPDADEPELRYQRARCLVAAGRGRHAEPDLRECLRLGTHTEEIESLLAGVV
jgi:tetratricopeptide (TPR) repeat protein